MTTDDRGIDARRVGGGMFVCVGIAVTAMLVARGLDAPRPSADLILQLGGIVSVAVALLLAGNARNRVIALHLRRELDALAQPRTHVESEDAPDPKASRRASRSIPAWFALVLGLAVTLVLGQDREALLWLVDSPLLVSASIGSTLLWAVACAGVAHDDRARRLRAVYETASLKGEIDALRGELEAAHEHHDEESARLEGQLASRSKACGQLRSDLQSAEADHRGAQEELDSTRDELAALDQAHGRLDEENRQLKSLVEKLHLQAETMRVDETSLRKELERADDELAKVNIRLEKARRLERELRTKMARLTTRAESLEEELSKTPAPPADPPAESPVPPPPAPSRPARTRADHPPDATEAPRSAPPPRARSAGRTGSGDAPQSAQKTAPKTAPGTGPKTGPETGPPPPQLRLPRLPTEFLTCNLGEIVELGCSEVRLFCPEALEGRMTVVLPAGKTKLRFLADVIGSKRVARRKHDVLLEFVGVEPDLARELLQIAMRHRRRSVLPINSIASD